MTSGPYAQAFSAPAGPLRVGGISMSIMTDVVLALYFVTVLWLATYGTASLVNIVLYWRSKRRGYQSGDGPPLPKEWPSVTIQLPVFNEKYTVERLLEAVTRLNYPRELLQIQVLDDSTDDTTELIRRLVDAYKSQAINVELLHRTNRAGYKAGALQDAFPSATGELIGIFDADFVPEPDWLGRTVPLFVNPRLGCLQTRWGHTNRKYNALTREEALAIDAHFIVEQSARSGNGLFLNFNGTAGLWRRACIEDAGGWQHDTLTEDLDLSYRAQLAGWKIDYLPDVIVPAELPSQVEAFKKQQFRWAKGSFQVVRKLLPAVLRRKDLSRGVKAMAALHLTGYMVHPLMLALLVLTLPVGVLAPIAFKILPFTFVAGFGPPLMCLVAEGRRSPTLAERIRMLPLMTITGFGISLSTSVAVIQGLLGTGGNHFTRTPKLNEGEVKRHKRIDQSYLEPVSPLVWGEIVLGVYALATGMLLEPALGLQIMPWMLIYAMGYFYVAGLNLAQHATAGGGRQKEPLVA